MSETRRELIDGLREAIADALAIAGGEEPAPRVHFNGHAYVSERLVVELQGQLAHVSRRLVCVLEIAHGLKTEVARLRALNE